MREGEKRESVRLACGYLFLCSVEEERIRRYWIHEKVGFSIHTRRKGKKEKGGKEG